MTWKTTGHQWAFFSFQNAIAIIDNQAVHRDLHPLWGSWECAVKRLSDKVFFEFGKSANCQILVPLSPLFQRFLCALKYIDFYQRFLTYGELTRRHRKNLYVVSVNTLSLAFAGPSTGLFFVAPFFLSGNSLGAKLKALFRFRWDIFSFCLSPNVLATFENERIFP